MADLIASKMTSATGGLTIGDTSYVSNAAGAGDLKVQNDITCGLTLTTGSNAIIGGNISGTGTVSFTGVGASSVGGAFSTGGNLSVTGTIDATSHIRSGGDVIAYYSSDISLKSNITSISSPLEKLSKIRGVEFDWSDDYIEKNGGEDGYFIRRHDVGVIAQEIQSILPEIVGKRQDGILAVKYDRIIPLLIEAIKELKDLVDKK